jgi:hypothetical protein
VCRVMDSTSRAFHCLSGIGTSLPSTTRTKGTMPHCFAYFSTAGGCCFQSKRLLYRREPNGVRAEPGKQKTRSCRTQELARSSARENEWQKKAHLPDSIRVGTRSRRTSAPRWKNCRESDGLQSVARRDAFRTSGHSGHEWRITATAAWQETRRSRQRRETRGAKTPISGAYFQRSGRATTTSPQGRVGFRWAG